MGAWAEGVFENDTASDWAEELLRSDRYQMIGAALEQAADASADGDADECSEALAAAELVAAGRGWPVRELPEELQEWVDRFDYRPSEGAKSLALSAIKRVRDGSELAKLWGGDPKWLDGLTKLVERLTNEPKPRSAAAQSKRPTPTDVASAVKRLSAQTGHVETTKGGAAKYVHVVDQDDATLIACLPFMTATRVLKVGWGDGGMAEPIPNTDAAFASLHQFSRLEQLHLSCTQVTDATLARLAGLTKLKALTLSRTRVTDAGLRHLAALTDLEELGLGSTRLSSEGLSHLRDLTKLRRLDLTKTAVDDDGLASLTGMRELSELDLRSSRVTGPGLAHLARLGELYILELQDNPIADEHLKPLAELTKLARLTLSGRRITDAALEPISRLKSLGALILDKTAVTDAGLRLIAKLPALQVLSLKGTKVTVEAARQLRKARPDLDVQGRPR